MSADPRFPRDDYEKITAELRDMRRRLDELERPTGSQRALNTDRISRQVANLNSLKTVLVNGTDFNGTVPNNESFLWFAWPTGGIQPTVTIDIPTGRVLVIATVNEAEITSSGGLIQAMASYRMRDSRGSVLIERGSTNWGRHRISQGSVVTSISNMEKPVIIDPVINPGPYKIEAWFGAWATAGNIMTSTIKYGDVSLRVEVLEPASGFSM